MKDPAPVAILAARIQRAYPSLSAYSSAALAQELTAIERAQRRHAERCCSGADGGYVKRGPVIAGCGREVFHDPDAEARAGARVGDRVRDWLWARLGTLCKLGDQPPTIELHGDPCGPVLLLRLPGESEASGV